MPNAPVLVSPTKQFSPRQGRPPNEDARFAGTTIAIPGRHFNVNPLSVKFGDIQAEVIGRSPSRLDVKVPDMPPGITKITVATAGGSVTSADDFEVLPFPVIFDLDPVGFSRDPSNEGLQIAINGEGFVSLDEREPVVLCVLLPRFDPEHDTASSAFQMPILSITPTQIVVAVPEIPDFDQFVQGTGRIRIGFSDGAEIESAEWLIEGL
jgi:hypothetical protein